MFHDLQQGLDTPILVLLCNSQQAECRDHSVIELPPQCKEERPNVDERGTLARCTQQFVKAAALSSGLVAHQRRAV